MQIRGRWLGPVTILAGGITYALGDLYLYAAMWHAGAILMVVGAVFTVLGVDMLRRFFPAFLVLVFLIPVPGRLRQQIAIPLQEATATVTTELCSALGVGVERTGNLIRINGVDVAVGEACNGMRMMFALVLVSFTFAFITELRPFVRVLIIVLSPFSALICNVVRLIPTVLVYGSYDSDAAQSFHDIAGWVMLFVAFALLLCVIRILKWLYVPVSPFRFAHD
jgi:exosortase